MADLYDLLVVLAVLLVLGAILAVGIRAWLSIGLDIAQAHNDRRDSEAKIASYREKTAVQRYLCDSSMRRSELLLQQSELDRTAPRRQLA